MRSRLVATPRCNLFLQVFELSLSPKPTKLQNPYQARHAHNVFANGEAPPPPSSVLSHATLQDAASLPYKEEHAKRVDEEDLPLQPKRFQGGPFHLLNTLTSRNARSPFTAKCSGARSGTRKGGVTDPIKKTPCRGSVAGSGLPELVEVRETPPANRSCSDLLSRFVSSSLGGFPKNSKP